MIACLSKKCNNLSNIQSLEIINMAKFFVSYSRNVKDDVRTVIEQLKADGRHEVWWDGDIPVVADWWATILANIEWCDILIFVVSEKSVRSPYCLEELKYAVERNRPILPFILDETVKNLPEELPSRNQWLVYDGIPQNMLSDINNACQNINWNNHKDIFAQRPPEPLSGGKSLAKQYQEARQLANNKDFEAAKKKFRDIKSLDYGEWGDECDQWIARINKYYPIMELVDPLTLLRAQSDWDEYVQLYGDDYDPYNIKSAIESLSKPQGKLSAKRSKFKTRLSRPQISLIFILTAIISISAFLITWNSGFLISPKSVFRIDPERSEVRISIGYEYFGTRTSMSAHTNVISGDVLLDLANPANASFNKLTADASTLETGSSAFEDMFLRLIILKPAPGEPNLVSFETTELLYLPSYPLNVGDVINFQMVGNLTVQGVTNSTVIDTTVTIIDENEIHGFATTRIRFGQYRIEIPYIPEVVPDNEITLEVDFVAILQQ
jgi:polyisoprenoid-binding protein YceI